MTTHAVVFLLAHLGHWYVSLVVYLGPIVLVVVWLALSGWRDRRRR